MTRAETVRTLVGRLHAAGGAPFTEEPAGSGVHHWHTRIGRWPFEVQVDRYGMEVRCYLADELFCTGRLPEDEADTLLASAAGRGDAGAHAALTAFVQEQMVSDSRRFLTPPHADRHPDRRGDPRHDAAIHAKPARRIDLRS